MYTENDIEMYKLQPPVLRQIAAFVFGLVFAFTNGYSGMQLLGAAIGAPLIFAGAIWLYTAVYRLARPVFAGCVWGSVIAAVLGFSGIGVVTSFLLAPAFQYSDVLGGILTVVLMLCGVAVFVWDVKRWSALHKA